VRGATARAAELVADAPTDPLEVVDAPSVLSSPWQY
jgi:hypothetical protein